MLGRKAMDSQQVRIVTATSPTDVPANRRRGEAIVHHSLPGSSVHGISQGRILEWVAISFSTEEWEGVETFTCTPSTPLMRVLLLSWCQLLSPLLPPSS